MVIAYPTNPKNAFTALPLISSIDCGKIPSTITKKAIRPRATPSRLLTSSKFSVDGFVLPNITNWNMRNMYTAQKMIVNPANAPNQTL